MKTDAPACLRSLGAMTSLTILLLACAQPTTSGNQVEVSPADAFVQHRGAFDQKPDTTFYWNQNPTDGFYYSGELDQLAYTDPQFSTVVTPAFTARAAIVDGRVTLSIIPKNGYHIGWDSISFVTAKVFGTTKRVSNGVPGLTALSMRYSANNLDSWLNPCPVIDFGGVHEAGENAPEIDPNVTGVIIAGLKVLYSSPKPFTVGGHWQQSRIRNTNTNEFNWIHPLADKANNFVSGAAYQSIVAAHGKDWLAHCFDYLPDPTSKVTFFDGWFGDRLLFLKGD